MTPAIHRYLELSQEVLFQRLNDGSVLLDLVREQYIGLDSVATDIWQMLIEDGNTEHVIARMLEKYDVDERCLRSDVADFIEQLRVQGLVRVAVVP